MQKTKVTRLFILGFLIFANLQVFALDQKYPKITGVTLDKNENGSVIELAFDKPFSAKVMKPMYERNFIQFILNKTVIDTARIVPASSALVSTNVFQKVFVYPYTADTTRVRLIFGSPKAPQGKINFWNVNPKTIRVQIKEQNSLAPIQVAKLQPKAPSTSAAEKELLNEVVTQTKEIDIHNPESVKEALKPANEESLGIKDSDKISGIQKEVDKEQVGTRLNPTKYFVRMMVSLLVVLGALVGVLFLVRKYSNKINKLPFGKKERMIQVISTHTLGKSKSISLVKIAGEYLVVGVGNENISLITRLGPEVDVGKYLDDRFWGGTFEKHLKTFEKKDSFLDEKIVEPKASNLNIRNYDGVRDLSKPDEFQNAVDQISDKVEISSFRSSIKDKLSKLKPLA